MRTAVRFACAIWLTPKVGLGGGGKVFAGPVKDVLLCGRAALKYPGDGLVFANADWENNGGPKDAHCESLIMHAVPVVVRVIGGIADG